jgi:ADP-ribose pyrophosphatase YjhB (NUDIX family)
MADVDTFDLIRKWFRAFNAGDIETLMTFYGEESVIDQGGEPQKGRAALRRLFEDLAARSAQRTVRMIARVEGGMMHAEWRGSDRGDEAGAVTTTAGYDEFRMDSGFIREQRVVLHPMTFPHDEEVGPPEASRPSRQYPSQPIVGVGAVIVHDGKVVLIKRRFEPLAGQWTLPGGRLELGETLEAGLAREMLEETGLAVQVGPVVDVFDRILLDPERRVRYHYVLIDYLCRPVGGALSHGSDVAAAEYADPSDLARYRLTPKATAVIQRAVAMAKEHQW